MRKILLIHICSSLACLREDAKKYIFGKHFFIAFCLGSSTVELYEYAYASALLCTSIALLNSASCVAAVLGADVLIIKYEISHHSKIEAPQATGELDLP